MTARRWLVFGVALMAMLTGGIAPTVSQAAGPNGADPHVRPHQAVQQGRHLTMAQLPAGLARVWRHTVLRDHLAGSGLAGTGAARLDAHSLSSFASTFAAAGPALHPLARSAGWSFSMTLAGYSRSTLHAVPRAQQTTHAGLTTYRHGRLLEWYRTTASGLEQGFTLPSAPAHAGHGPVVLSLHIGGSLHAIATGHEIVLGSRTGVPVLHYGGLRATDAHGRPLPAHLVVIGSSVRLVLDDRGAQYPLHIDPYIQGQKLVAADPAYSDNFGSSVALSGDGNTALIGADNKTVNGQTNAGAAYVFVRPSGGTTWTQQQELTASDAAYRDNFGSSVALSDDGNTALIGAYNKTVNGQTQAGAAYVFVRPSGGTAWTQQQELTASDVARDDQFATSVSLSADGNTALIGALYRTVNQQQSAGAAYVFVRPSGGTTWTQQQELTASDASQGNNFGSSVSLSDDGNTALIGAYNKTVNGQQYAGAAYVFVRPSGGTAWTQQQELTASDASYYDHFGSSVALSGDGNTGLSNGRTGVVYAETLTGTRAALSGRPTGCANGSTTSITVTLTPTMGATGTTYQIDANSAQTYSGPFVVSGIGSYTITYHSTFSGGYVEPDQTITVQIVGPPTITLGASSGSLGDAIPITGSVFQAGEMVSLYLDSASSTPFASVTAGGDCALPSSFSVPEASYGSHSIIAVGQSSGQTGSVPFSINPTTRILSSGPTFGLYGFGFGAGETVTVHLDSPTGTVVGSTMANSKGTFSPVIFSKPSISHRLYAVGQTTGATAFSLYIVPPSLSINRSSGVPGSSATITGYNFGPGETVTALWDCTSASCTGATSVGTATSDSSGNVSIPITIPSTAMPGSYHVIGVLGQSTTAFGTLSFYLPQVSASINPGYGTAGSKTTVSGANYGAGEAVTAYFDCTAAPCMGKTAMGTSNAASDGTISFQSTIPANASPATTYTIGILGSPSRGFTTVSYTVTGGPTVARVSGLALHRHGSTLLLSWRLAHPAGVVGFDLFAGATRLTTHSIPVHAAREYRFRTTQTTAGRYSLQVILRNGQRIVIPFSAGR